jgi:nucleotide-binding universal stress UspA family protein
MKLFHSSQRVSETAQPVAAGRVIVLVDDPGSDADTIDWAAAEAVARGSELRIVHAFRWPYALDPFGNLAVDPRFHQAAEAIVATATRRAHHVAPSLPITTFVYPGRAATALVKEARTTDRALVVVGHDRGVGSLTRRLARRTTATVAMVGLSDQAAIDRSFCKIVAGVDGDSQQPMGLAFCR